VTRADATVRIREFVAETFRLPAGEEGAFGDEESLLANGVIDSMGILALVTFTEEAFGIAVDDDDLVPENFDSIAALAALVERKSAAAA
jgi:acyl carrier protein